MKHPNLVNFQKHHPPSWYNNASCGKKLLRISEDFSESQSTIILLKGSWELFGLYIQREILFVFWPCFSLFLFIVS